ncbi:MAG: iron ABC transporter permease [Pseudomonadota bacterium]
MTNTQTTNWYLPTLVLCTALAGLSVWAISVGSTHIPMLTVVQALTDPSVDSREAQIIRTVRLPRVLAAIIVGAALAVAGAIMQAATNNPLADPGLLGVNAGAAFAVVVLIVIKGPAAGIGALAWAAFLGAAVAAVLVYGLGALGRSGPTPVKLVLAGVVIGTFLAVLTMTILLVDGKTLDAVRLWTAGSLRGRVLGDVVQVMPYIALGLILAMLFRDQFTALSLGADVAQGLGQNPAKWRAVSAGIVVLLAGGSVAIAGPLGFVGLVVPHMARLTLGPDYRNILPLAMLGGALLTLLADALPRAVWRNDIPIGISLALVGGPFFIWLARRSSGLAR